MKVAVTLVLSLGLLINSFVPLGNVLVQSSDIIDNALAAESTVFSVLAGTVLPFRAVGRMVSKGLPLCDEMRRVPTPEKQTPVPAHDPSSSSLIPNAGAGPDWVTRCELAGFTAGVPGSMHAPPVSVVRPPGPGGYLVLLFLLGYLVLLSRMNIPASIQTINRSFMPGPRKDGRVSYFREGP